MVIATLSGKGAICTVIRSVASESLPAPNTSTRSSPSWTPDEESRSVPEKYSNIVPAGTRVRREMDVLKNEHLN